jgi:AraC family transcriptional activator of pobA
MNRNLRRHIPSFSLYGESTGAKLDTDPLHIEDIQSRSRKYLWRIGSHRHVGLCQCVFVTAGPVAVDIEGSRVQCSGPIAFAIPAGTVHGFDFEAESQGYVLTMDLDRLLGVAGMNHHASIAALFRAPQTIEVAADRPLAMRASQVFECLMQEFSQPDSLLAPLSGWLACAALWMLASASLHTPPTAAPGCGDLDRLRRFRRLVELHHLEHWPVSRYARELALSESSLNRSCCTVAGATAFDIIQQRLALEARRRLLYVAAPVALIAAELGFKDPGYFCRFFRKHNHVSPSAFRRRQTDG